MTTNSGTSGRLAAGSLAAAAVAVLAAANPAAGTGDPASDAVLSFQTASLPQTADAVEGWYTQPQTEHEATTTSNMSQTPPAVGGWFIQRRTGQRFVINAVAPSSEATETATATATADPAANWRRLMVEVP